MLRLSRAAGIFAQNQNDGQKNGSQNQSVVYFTRNVSSAGLLKVYRALNQKIEGNVGIKVSFGGPDEEVLQPELLRDLVRTTGGTMFDGNGLSGNRRTSEMNLSHARRHGFMEIGKCIIHSGSTDENHYHSMPADVLEKSFADAAKAEWKAALRVGMVEQLEKLGGGTRNYRLVEVK